jgi:hypothetical protein
VKKLLTIPLILIMMAKPLWPIAEYIINYDYIVTKLCENRNRPQLQCDGKCYLAKMFAKESTDHNQNPFNEGQMMEVNLFFQIDVNANINYLNYTLYQLKKLIHSFDGLHDFLFVFEIIQPPETT